LVCKQLCYLVPANRMIGVRCHTYSGLPSCFHCSALFMGTKHAMTSRHCSALLNVFKDAIHGVVGQEIGVSPSKK